MAGLVVLDAETNNVLSRTTQHTLFHSLLDPQNREVGKKLGLATAAMFTVPLAAFYGTSYFLLQRQQQQQQPALDNGAGGSSSASTPSERQRYSQVADNYAAAAAIFAVNVIIAVYCLLAYYEDRDEKLAVLSRSGAGNHNNDADAPRVGIYKQRVD
jgi:VMA21-like domain